MKQQMRITVKRPDGKSISIAQFKKLSLFERGIHKWFGRAEKLMIIVPEDSVQSIEIKEV